MTFLERLQAHEGGLLRIRSELFWYDRGVWDNNPGRVCLILDAARREVVGAVAVEVARVRPAPAAAHLLIDGSPQWVWVVDADVEMIDEAR